MDCEKCKVPLFISSNKETLLCKKCGNVEQVKKSGEDDPKKKYPPIKEQAKNLIGETVKFAKSGFNTVSNEEYEERMSICRSCPENEWDEKKSRCRKCGCFMLAKAKMAQATCPYGFWKKEKNEEI